MTAPAFSAAQQVDDPLQAIAGTKVHAVARCDAYPGKGIRQAVRWPIEFPEKTSALDDQCDLVTEAPRSDAAPGRSRPCGKSMDKVCDKLEEAALYIKRNPKTVKSITSFPYIVGST
jgi:hypothetical protein